MRTQRKPYQPVLVNEHMPTCWAIKNQKRGFWQTPWAYLSHVDYRDSLGRKRGNHTGSRWWYVGCNCTGCPAGIWVCETEILGRLPPGRMARSTAQRDSKP